MIWRAYQIQIPKELADRFDAAVERQSRRENRVVGISEMMCWVILCGLREIDEEITDGQITGPNAGRGGEHERGGEGRAAPPGARTENHAGDVGRADEGEDV